MCWLSCAVVADSTLADTKTNKNSLAFSTLSNTSSYHVYETTILIGCEMCTSIISTNKRLHYKVTSENQSHPREPLMCFDLEVSKPHELSDFNIDQIGCAWCQSIGNWGQKTQILHRFWDSHWSKQIIFEQKVKSTAVKVKSTAVSGRFGRFWAGI